MSNLSQETPKILETLRKVVATARDRKRRLGHYAESGKMISSKKTSLLIWPRRGIQRLMGKAEPGFCAN